MNGAHYPSEHGKPTTEDFQRGINTYLYIYVVREMIRDRQGCQLAILDKSMDYLFYKTTAL